MVEMPVLPGALDEMKAVLIELDRLGAFGINLIELVFPFHRADEFRHGAIALKPDLSEFSTTTEKVTPAACQ